MTDLEEFDQKLEEISDARDIKTVVVGIFRKFDSNRFFCSLSIKKDKRRKRI